MLELADTMGLHANTVRKHLELLVDYGHVTRLRDESGRPGRPRQVYVTADTSDEVGSEQRDYRLLARILASYLREADDPQGAAVKAGRHFGAEFVGTSGPDDTEQNTPATLDRVVRMLAAIGFQPDLTDDRTAIRLHHCPFHELARDQPTSCAASTSD